MEAGTPSAIRALVMLRQDVDCISWDVVRPWIEDACEHGDGWWTLEKIVQMLCEGTAVLWVLEDAGTPIAAVVTAIAQWDGLRVAELVAQGGSGVIDALSDNLHMVEDWAREHRASEVVFRGRRGLTRVFKPYGYEEIAVTLRKAL